MQKHSSKLAFLLSLVIIFQLVSSAVPAFAASSAAPTNLKATISNINDIYLKWDADYYSRNFLVYKLNGDQKELITKTTNRYVSLSKVAEGTHEYAVSTLSSNGEESALSTSVKVDIVYPEVNAPTGLTFINYSGNDILLKWNSAANATNYKIYQVIDGQKTLITTTNNTSHYFSRLAEGDYKYEVTTYSNRFGESETASQISVSIVFPELQPPAGLTANIYNGNDLALNWEKADYANKYNIYRVLDGQKELVTSTNDRQIYISKVSEGDYVYEVTTVSDRFGESETSSQVSVSIVYPDLQAPMGLAYKIYNGNDLSLDWQDMENANKYNIYRIVADQKELVTTVSSSQHYFSQMLEGNYTYEVTTVSNRFGESEEGSQINVPIIYPEIQAPEGITYKIYYGNDLSIDWQDVDYADKYNVYRLVDGGKELITTVRDSQHYFSQLPEGDYTYEVTAVSNRFGESAQGSQISVSLVHPEIQPPSDLTYQILNGNDVLLKWEKPEYANKYNVFRVVDGKREKVITTQDLQYYFSQLPEGDYVYEVTTISNRFGESQEASQVAFKIEFPEIQAPVIHLEMPEPDNAMMTWDKVSYANSYLVYEFVNGEAVFLAKVSSTTYVSSNLTDGKHEYAVVAVSNRFGESLYSNKVVAEVKPKLAPPPASAPIVDGDNVTLGWGPVEGAESYNIYEEVNGERVLVGSTSDTMLTIPDLEAGEHEFIIVPVTKSGVEGDKFTTVPVTTKVTDETPPVTKSNVEEDRWLRESFLVELSATDDSSGVEKTFYSVNGSDFIEGTSFVVSEAGVTTVSFYSVDNAGNVEEAKTVEVKIDEDPPVTTSNVTDEWLNESYLLKLTATDDNSGVKETYYSLNGAEYVKGATVFVSNPGVNTVSFLSVDNAGNIEEVKTEEVKIDTVAPETVSNVIEQWNQGEVAVELTATDDLSGVEKTFYSINGSGFAEGTAITVSEEGVNEVKFYSVDNAGNIEEAKIVEVKIDKTAPTVSFDVQSEQELGSTFTVDYLAADNLSGIAVEEVTLNGKTYQKDDQITLDEPGAYKLHVTVTDAAGWTTQVEKEFVVYIPATLEVLPKVIKGNKGIFTVKAILPTDLQKYSFDVSSVILNGVAADPKNNGLQKQAEKGHFKFEREDFDWKKGEVTLVLRGYLDNGYLVIAKKTVEVK